MYRVEEEEEGAAEEVAGVAVEVAQGVPATPGELNTTRDPATADPQC